MVAEINQPAPTFNDHSMTTTLTWQCATFGELTTSQLYAILRARCDVFVVEQHCVYPDIDGLDPGALHVTGWTPDGTLAAYLRILAPGVTYVEPALGRVLCTAPWRGSGAGRQLVQQGLQRLQQHYGNSPVRIGAQAYLTAFYASFGFEVASAPYVEDGIDHVEMLLQIAPGASCAPAS